MRGWLVLGAIVAVLGWDALASAQSFEDENGCSGTTVDPCVRTGTCSVQGTAWSQVVTIDRADLYDTMGWPGLCDQVHVALVQGRCSPGGAQLDVTASLTSSSSAFIPELVGSLTCGAEPAPLPLPSMGPSGVVGLVVGMLGLGLMAMRSGVRERA